MNRIGIFCFLLLLFNHATRSQECKDDKWKKWEKCGGCKRSKTRECLDDENITERRSCEVGKKSTNKI